MFDFLIRLQEIEKKFKVVSNISKKMGMWSVRVSLL